MVLDGFPMVNHGLMLENHRKMVVKNGGLMGFNQQNGDFSGMYPLVICYSLLTWQRFFRT